MKNNLNGITSEELCMHYILRCLEHKKAEKRCKHSGSIAEARKHQMARMVLMDKIKKLETMSGMRTDSKEISAMK